MWTSIIIFITDKLLAWPPNFSKATPQTIKNDEWRQPLERHYIRLLKKFPNVTEYDGSMSLQPYHDRCRQLAYWYKVRADMSWGRGYVRTGFKTAYRYAIAACFYAEAGDYRAAANQYHYSGNQFRQVEAYRASIQFYLYSAWCFYLFSDTASQVRTLRRALAVARLCAEDQLADDITEAILLSEAITKDDLGKICCRGDGSKGTPAVSLSAQMAKLSSKVV